MAAYPASLLISRAWYLSGIVSRQFETVSGQQTADGLFLLNALLEFKATDTRLIPYWSLQEVNLVSGQELYFIPNLLDVETFTFNIGPIRYPTSRTSRMEYFGRGRVDNILSLPFQWRLERVDGGANLYVFPLPTDNYVAHTMGKYGLTDVALTTNLADTYDGFYIEYLRYALAQYMCEEYNIDFAPEKAAKMMQIEKKLSWVSPPDLTLRKVNFINNPVSINWAQMNIGKGWTA